MNVPGWRCVALKIVLIAVGTCAAQTVSRPIVQKSSGHAVSGSYIGFDIGGHFTSSQVSGLTNQGGTPTDLNRTGLIGGIQFGYGRQFRRLYYGVEGDSNFGQFVSAHVQSTHAGSSTSAYAAHRKFVGTARARTGFLCGRWLVYGTGGLAIGRLQQSVSVTGSGAADVAQTLADNEGVEFGWSAGEGVEYKVNRRLSYTAKSVYYHFADQTLPLAAVSGPGSQTNAGGPTLQNSGNILTVGVKYHF